MTTENKISYFQERMNLLGVTEEQNKIGLLQNDLQTGKDILKDIPVFTEGKKPAGIDILVYTLDRTTIRIEKEGSRFKESYKLTRLEKPFEKKDGSVQKYHIPKGAGTHPFFHPSLIDKFEKKEKIDTLFIIEGFFKSWKGCMHGMDVVGVSSITHLKEKDTGLLHRDIRRIRDICQVKRMVWLTDGDCLDITSKELKDGIDLYRRPKNFFSSCETFKNLLDDWEGEKWFFHINSNDICNDHKISRDECKGLDDLLITLKDHVADIVSDSKTVAGNSRWFVKQQISYDTRRIYNYFHLSSVNDFYLFHVQRRKELKDVEFQFNGTRYKYDEKDTECKIVVPAEAKLYFRVGDTYYKNIEKINQFGDIEHAFEKRQKSTIVDDHSAKFIKHIRKFEAFCNVPGHMDHHSVIHNNYNVYFPFEHEPDEDDCTENDCPNIINYLKHLFGDHLVKVKQTVGDPINTSYYQLGLDYLQLLYQKPTVRLPILCLVSKENETGKSTFGDLLKAIFTNNATVVGNSDLADDFNSFWATKLLIMCDEAKIDKHAVIEKVKSLTFARKIGLNAKGKDKIEIDFFGKFLFFTNNEDNFIYASEEDLRYWVIKVPRLKVKDPDFLVKMIDEIPQLLSMLNHRKMVAPRMTRMWFDPELLKTEALRKVILNSHSTVKKELTYYIKQMFLDFDCSIIQMTCRAIKENFFRNKEENYIERVLKEEMKIRPVQWWIYKGEKFPEEELAMEAAKKDGLNEMEAIAAIKTSGRVLRHSYPRFELRAPEFGKPTERMPVLVKDCGRAYQFRREEFVNEDERAEVPADIKEMNELMMHPETHVIGKQNGLFAQSQAGPDKSDSVDDLPF